MMNTKGVLSFLFMLCFVYAAHAEVIVSDGIAVDLNLEYTVDNQQEYIDDRIIIENQNDGEVLLTLSYDGDIWDGEIEQYVVLGAGQKTSLPIRLFFSDTYSTTIDAPDYIKLKYEKYRSGMYSVPLLINIENKETSLFSISQKVIVVAKEVGEVYTVDIEQDEIGPGDDLLLKLKAFNNSESFIRLSVLLGEEEFVQQFNMKAEEEKNVRIDLEGYYPPGQQKVRAIVRKEQDQQAFEWYFDNIITIQGDALFNATQEEEGNSFTKTINLTVTNNGNIEGLYRGKVSHNMIQYLVASFDGINDSERSVSMRGAEFALKVEPGQTRNFVIQYRYYYLYELFIVVVLLAGVLAFIYSERKNPLQIKTEVSNIKRSDELIEHFDVRIYFRNISTEKINHMQFQFKLPVNFAVDQKSFTLGEPNKVFKTKDHYKLTWVFKNFDVGESRIIGFSIVNKKKIIQPLALEPLEIKVHKPGKKDIVFKKKFKE